PSYINPFPPRRSSDLGATAGEAPIDLPLELRNRLSRLVLAGPPSAASVVLLDENWRRRPVALASGEQSSAEAPLTGSLYYLRRADRKRTRLNSSHDQI